jgi:hypothetical protein
MDKFARPSSAAILSISIILITLLGVVGFLLVSNHSPATAEPDLSVPKVTLADKIELEMPGYRVYDPVTPDLLSPDLQFIFADDALDISFGMGAGTDYHNVLRVLYSSSMNVLTLHEKLMANFLAQPGWTIVSHDVAPPLALLVAENAAYRVAVVQRGPSDSKQQQVAVTVTPK